MDNLVICTVRFSDGRCVWDDAMTMKTSQAGIDLIKQHEGLRLEAYPDPASGAEPWTIGYGHTKGVMPGQRITQEQAEQFLRDDLWWAEDAVNGSVTVNITQAQFDALVSLIFNIGATAFKKSTLLRKLNDFDYEGAADEFLKWVKAAGKEMPGLVNRRKAERALFLSPAPIETITVPKEKDMAPFIAAALPSLIQAAPSLIRIFGKSERSEQNAQAAQLVADIAKESTGQTTIEGAVQAIQADPAAAAAYREAVHKNMGDLMTIMERANDLEQKNIAAARQYNALEPLFVSTKWLKLRFIHILSLIFVGFSGWFVVAHWAEMTAELKGAVVTLMMIAGYNGVRDYWMGSSNGSERKTEMLTKGGS